jgi:hypothetical protein
MGDDHPARPDGGHGVAQMVGHVFVGQSVEAVAAHAFRIEALGNGVAVRQFIVRAMEGGIETGNLGKLWKAREDRADRRQIVRLMQRRQRRVSFKIGDNVAVDQDRPIVFWAAVDDPLTDGDRLDLSRLAQPCARGLQGCGYIFDLFGSKGLVDQRLLVGRFRAQTRPRADAVDLPLDQALRPAGRLNGKHLELDAGRAGVDDKNCFHDGHAAGNATVLWRASA